MKKYFILIFFILGTSSFLWAGGKKEEAPERVKGDESWVYKEDLSDKKPGVYNFIVKSTDKAGNESIAGPIDIVIDPDSDKPRSQIVWPRNTRVLQGDVNILGLAFDDDRVAKVLIKIDEGDWQNVSGLDFWSFSLNTKDLKDGTHRLYTKSIDSHGLEGDEFSRSFILDKRAPSLLLESHKNASSLSGIVQLSGTVKDLNGLKALSYGFAEEGEYKKISFKYNKNDGLYHWHFKWDTRKNSDGEQVLWLKTQSETTIEGRVPYLFFIDNQKPELEIFDLPENFVLTESIPLYGRVFDRMGIKSLTLIDSNKKEIDIPLKVGNPIWNYTIPIDTSKSSKNEISLIAIDNSGNSIRVNKTFVFDSSVLEPELSLLYPSEGEQIDRLDSLEGAVKFKNSKKRGTLFYKVDKQDEVAIDNIRDLFSISLQDVPPLAAGDHSISLFIRDFEGHESQRVLSHFTIKDSFISLSLDEYQKNKKFVPYFEGIKFKEPEKILLKGHIKGNFQGESLWYSFAGADFKKISLPKADQSFKRNFSLSLSSKKLKGVIPLNFKLIKKDQRELYFNSNIIIEPHIKVKKDEIPPPFILPKELIFSEEILKGKEPFFIDKERGLRGFITEGVIQSISISPSTKEDKDQLFKIKLNENKRSFEIFSEKPFLPDYFTVTVQLKGGEILKKERLFLQGDRLKPSLNFKQRPDSFFLNQDMTLNMIAQDNLAGLTINYSIKDSEGQNLIKKDIGDKIEEKEDQFEFKIPLVSLQDGFYLLQVEVSDASFNKRFLRAPFLLDTKAPDILQVLPLKGESVDGNLSFAGQITETEDITNIDYSVNGIDWEPLTVEEIFFKSESLTAESLKDVDPQFRVKDKANNIAFFKPTYNFSFDKDKPVITLQLPQENEIVKKNQNISGVAFDDDGINTLFFRLDGGEWQENKFDKSGFTIFLNAENMEEKNYNLELQGRDIFGYQSDIISRSFTISLDGPEIKILNPKVNQTIHNKIFIEGTASDPNGVSALYISVDNGSSWNRIEGTSQWRYELDTSLFKEGGHSFLIKGIDDVGMESLQTMSVNIDNTPPQLQLLTPLEGESVVKKIELDGKVDNPNDLKYLTLHIQPIYKEANVSDAIAPIQYQLDVKEGGVFSKTISLDFIESQDILCNLSLEAEDLAGNKSVLARDIFLTKEEGQNIRFLYPFEGETLRDYYAIEGQVTGDDTKKLKAILYIDNLEYKVLSLYNGYFSYSLDTSLLSEGSHKIGLKISGSPHIDIINRSIEIAHSGPVVKVISHSSGDLISGRPWLKGEAYWFDPSLEKTPHKVKQVSISFDDGRSFTKVKGKSHWAYRLESQNWQSDSARILLRAEFDNGEIATKKIFLNIDNLPPEVEINTPTEENKKFNQSLFVQGDSFDNQEGVETTFQLREGSKSRYEVPSFIQGLYLDVHALGATYYDVGLGLTFFEDNVKLQAQFGQAPPGRFDGNVFGIKLLANVAKLPFSYWFGPDLDFFSMSFALGSNFSYYSMGADEKGVAMGAVLAQWEMAKFSFKESPYFRYFSLYSELSYWFISSDVNAGAVPKISIGARFGFF